MAICQYSGRIMWCKLCDGFNVVEGYIIPMNKSNPARINKLLVFRRKRQVVSSVES